MLIALLALAGGFLVAFAVTPLTAGLARRFGIYDHPDPSGRKQHHLPTPYLGGVAIVCGAAAGATLLLFSGADPFPTPGSEPAKTLALGIVLAATLAGFGLIDDIRPLPRTMRVGAQVLAAFVAWELGFRVSATSIPWLNLALTIVWIVGITNAFNLLDNMDGLSAGLAGVSALSFGVMSYLGGLSYVAIAAAAIAGASFGFLAHNKHPAKIFMGDAGSLFLGFTLALVGIQLKFDNLVKVTFLVPVVVLGIPIFDTTLVVLSRLRAGRSPFSGGRDHVSHRLVRVGLPVKVAVGLLYWSGICLGWLGLVISRSNVQVGWMLLGFVIALGVFFGALLWRVPDGAQESSPIARVQEPIDLEELTAHRRVSR